MSKLRLLTIVFAIIMGVQVWSQTTVHNAPSGQIVLSSSEYVNNLTRQYNIYTGSNSQVALDFVYNTEPNYDFIYVYECDGSFNKLGLIATLHGQSSINLQTSTPNGRVVVFFVSDKGTCGADEEPTAGFTINWSKVESSGIATNNSLSPSDQVLIGSVSSAANIKIQEYQNKSLGDIKEPIQDYSNSMILLETESGRKLGLSYNKIGTNGNLGIAADGYMALNATDYLFGTTVNSNAFKISSNGNIGINDPIRMDGLINGRINGNAWEGYLKLDNSTKEYSFSIMNCGSEIGASFSPGISGTTKDSAPGLYFVAKNNGTSPGSRGVMTFDSRHNDKSAAADMVVFEYCSGYGNRLAHITGEGSFYVKKDIETKGTIRATEIKVEAQTADFVFDDDYSLRDLNEVESFINDNKHLPGIPSAAQMEANGVNLAEMNKLLLMKVEELTLYVIEQESRLKVKEDEVNALMGEFQELKENMDVIASLLQNK